MKISFNKIVTGSLSLLSLVFLPSCVVTRAEYIPVNKVMTNPRGIEFVEYFVIKPKRNAIGLGYVSVNGNEFSKHHDVINEAKKKAAELGGSFILEEKTGVEKKSFINPGYSSYEDESNARISGNRYSFRGSANQSAHGYSVGPSVSTVELPWAIYSVWVYTPSKFGIDIDEDNIVTGFHLRSDAESSGVMIGDRIIGIDGLDVNDEAISQHMMEIYPEDKITLTLSRCGQRFECCITALTN